MSKFHVGDLVRIRDKTELLQMPHRKAINTDSLFLSLGGLGFLEEMLPYCGTNVILKTVSMRGTGRWIVEGSGAGEYYWDEDWLEPVTPPVLISNSDLEDLRGGSGTTPWMRLGSIPRPRSKIMFER